MDLKDPKILIIGGVVLIGGAVLLMKGGGGSSQVAASNVAANTGNNAIGGTYSYLDGSGIQHLIATDPNGNLTSYAADQPPFSSPSQGLLSTYSGYTGTSNGTPWLYGGSPSYATSTSIMELGGTGQNQPGQGLSSTSTTGPFLVPTGQVGSPYPGLQGLGGGSFGGFGGGPQLGSSNWANNPTQWTGPQGGPFW